MIKEDFCKLIEETAKREGYLIGDSLGNISLHDNTGVGIIDPLLKRIEKSGILWWRKEEEIYAHIASFLNHPDGSISATVFGRDNLTKIKSLADRISKFFNGQEIKVGLARENVKYGPDNYCDAL